MAANIKIKVDNKEAVQGVNEVIAKVNEAQKAASKPIKIGNQGVDKIKQAQKSLNSFKRIAVSGIGKQVTGAFAGIGKALLSPIGAAIVSFEILYKICKAYYSQIREGENKKLDSQNRLNTLKQESKQLEEEKKKSEDLAKILQEINSHEKLTNTEREFAVSLVNQLNEGYEGMNLQIDKSTGKVKNLNQEMAKLRQLQKQQEIGNITQQMNSLKNAIDAQLNEIFTDFVQGFKSLGSDNFAFNLPTKTDRMKANLSDMFGGIGEVREIYSHLGEIQDALDAAGDDFVKRMEVVEKVIFPLIQDTEDKTKLAGLIGSSDWKEMKEHAKRLNELKNTQSDINKLTNEYIQSRVKLNQAAKKEKNPLDQLEEWKKKTQRDREFNAAPAQKQVEMLTKQIEQADKKLVQLNSDLKEQGNKYAFDLPNYQGQIEDLRKKINDAIAPEYKKMLEDQLAQLIAKQYDADIAIQASLSKQRQLEEDINKATQQRINKTNELADIQKKVAKAEQDFFGSQLKSLQSKAYQMAGRQMEYQLKEMKEKFKQQFKRDATSEEENAMKDIIGANFEMNHMQKNPVQIESTITNELARKGGFASSVVVEDANSVNKRILDANEKQVSLYNKMLSKVEKLETTVKEFGVIR